MAIYKDKKLLVGAGLLFCAFLILQFIQPVNSEHLYSPFNDIKFEFFAILAVSIVPFYEEFIFRGVFNRNNIIKIIALVLCFFFIFFLFESMVIYGLYIIMGLSLVISFKKKGYFRIILFCTNALLFAIIHESIFEIEFLITRPAVYYRTALAFVFIWIAINFNYFKAVMAHAINNLVSVIMILIRLQFVETTESTYSNENLKITYSEVPIFKSNQARIKYAEDTIYIKNLSLPRIHQQLLLAEGRLNETMWYKNQYKKYNIILSNVEDTNKPISKLFLDFMIQRELAIKSPTPTKNRQLNPLIPRREQVF